MRPSRPMTAMLGRSCRRPSSKSVGSWPGAILRAPVLKPNRTNPSLVNGIVRLHRDGPVGDGEDDLFADDIRVAWVSRVDSDGCVGEDGLRARGGNRDRPRAIGERVSDVPEMALLVCVHDLDVGDGRVAMGAPVGDTLTLV